MSKKRIAINGFGRIGRLAFRRLYKDPEAEVVCINCSHPTDEIAHLLKYDSIYRRFVDAEKVEALEHSLKIGDYEIAVTTERDAALLPWKDMNIDIVIDCTGAYTKVKKAVDHISAGAKKVVISAPGDEMPTIVYGVNEGTIKPEDNIISAASCTTNCLAPMVYNLNKLVPILKGYMTTIHAYTGDQRPLDYFHKKVDFGRERSCAMNIVPNTTGAAKAIGKVIPELDGKLDGSAQRVPTPTGSLAEVCCVVEGDVTADEINACMKAAQTPSYAYTEEKIVSSDIIGMEAGSCFDATQTKCTPIGNGTTLVKVLAWYDNEYSYTCNMIRTVKYLCQYV